MHPAATPSDSGQMVASSTLATLRETQPWPFCHTRAAVVTWKGSSGLVKQRPSKSNMICGYYKSSPRELAACCRAWNPWISPECPLRTDSPRGVRRWHSVSLSSQLGRRERLDPLGPLGWTALMLIDCGRPSGSRARRWCRNRSHRNQRKYWK